MELQTGGTKKRMADAAAPLLKRPPSELTTLQWVQLHTHLSDTPSYPHDAMRDFVLSSLAHVADAVDPSLCLVIAKVVLFLIERHCLATDSRFLLSDGVHLTTLLDMTLLPPTYPSRVDNLLESVLAFRPLYVLHAPALMDMLYDLLYLHYEPAFLRTLLRVGGVHVAFRILKYESITSQPRSLLCMILSQVSWTEEDRHRVLRLWPQRLAMLAEVEWPEGPPVTSYECPITLMPCVDPVVVSDGHTYERDAILTHLFRGGTSPMTRAPLRTWVVAPNTALIKRRPFVSTTDAAVAPQT